MDIDMEIPNVPGFGFYPTNEQLLLGYLRQRILDSFQDASVSTNAHVIPDVDLNRWRPWDLRSEIERLSIGGSDREEWYFFCRPKEADRNSKCSERMVGNFGYWKATGKKRKVRSETTNEKIGFMNVLVFYKGSPPRGIKTDWFIRECYLLPSYVSSDARYTQDQEMPFVACCLYKRAHDGVDDESTHQESDDRDDGTSDTQESAGELIAAAEVETTEQIKKSVYGLTL